MFLAILLTLLAVDDAGSTVGTVAAWTGGTGALGLLGWIAKEIRAQRDGIKSEVKAELKNEQAGAKTQIANDPLIVSLTERFATDEDLARHIKEDAEFQASIKQDLADMRELLQGREDRMNDRINRMTEKLGELVGVVKKGARS